MAEDYRTSDEPQDADVRPLPLELSVPRSGRGQRALVPLGVIAAGLLLVLLGMAMGWTQYNSVEAQMDRAARQALQEDLASQFPGEELAIDAPPQPGDDAGVGFAMVMQGPTILGVLCVMVGGMLLLLQPNTATEPEFIDSRSRDDIVPDA